MIKFPTFKSLFAVLLSFGFAFIAGAQTYTIGTGTTSNAGSGYPTPYGNWDRSAKHQILYTKAELNAVGMVGACKISALAFNVRTAAGTPLTNFTIGLKHTSVGVLAATAGSWETGFTAVYSPGTYTDVAGWNTHTFSTPFCWDGVSNILIQICFNNTNFTTNSQVYNSTSAGVSTHFVSNNAAGANVCTSTANGTANSTRPNTRFITSPSALDAQVTAIVGPPAVLTFGVNYPISLTIKNNACLGNLTSATIGYKWNNSPVVTIPWTGSIAPGASATIPITPDLTASPTGINTLKGFVVNPNGGGADAVPANDTLSTSVLVTAAGGTSAYEGTDFWVSFMDNNNGAAVNLILFLTSTKNSIANVVAPFAGINNLSIAIPANAIIPVVIPQVSGGITMSAPNSTVVSKTGIHVTSDNPISLYGSNQSAQSTDAWTSIPVNNLGMEYIVLAPTGGSATSPSEFIVVAQQNATTITIQLPAGKAAVSRAAGTTWTAILNQGETYLVKSNGGASDATDLTGTRVTSDKPVAVFGGTACGGYPAAGNRGGYAACSYCDHMVEQMIPTSAWGRNYVLAPFIYPADAMQTGGNFARVVSYNVGTTNYTVSGFPAQSLVGTGNYKDFKINANGAVITSPTNPVFVSQILAGNCCYGGSAPLTSVPGDPATLNIIPEEQWGQYYPFATADPSADYYDNFINIVCKSATAKVFLDNIQIYPTFINIPGSVYYYANMAVSQGSHYLISDTPLMVYVYGIAPAPNSESYAYPASGSTLYSIALPISFVSFNAKLLNSQVKLTWTTASEKNNIYFEVERSSDGINYNKIGENISGSGNSSVIQNYNTIDSRPMNGINYYRLKQVDINGEFSYSKIASVDINSKIIRNIIVSPSPIKDIAQITYNSNQDGEVKGALYDISGRKIKDLQDFKMNEGSNTLNLNLSDFSKGFYFLKLTSTNGFQENIKLIKE